HVWDVITKARELREDLKVFFLSHDELITENFQPKRKIKTIGEQITCLNPFNCWNILRVA
ncbi:MAG: hypothetical protein ACTSX1_00050, partial [Candidatus Heimdallarchaeaceae archaeon]